MFRVVLHDKLAFFVENFHRKRHFFNDDFRAETVGQNDFFSRLRELHRRRFTVVRIIERIRKFTLKFSVRRNADAHRVNIKKFNRNFRTARSIQDHAILFCCLSNARYISNRLPSRRNLHDKQKYQTKKRADIDCSFDNFIINFRHFSQLRK